MFESPCLPENRRVLWGHKGLLNILLEFVTDTEVFLCLLEIISSRVMIHRYPLLISMIAPGAGGGSGVENMV